MNRRALAQARSESELFYLRARYYDPRTAQFISRDPAVSSTREPYAYAGDTPLDASDPSGMCWPSWACGAENWAGGQKDRLHGFVAAHASQIENVANVADTVSTVASFAEVGCAGAALAATAGILTIPADVPLAGCVAATGLVSTGTLGLAAGLHGAACWGGDPNQACGAAIIDGFTLPIGIFGGKAAESILEGVTGRTFLRGFAEAAARGGCDYLGGQISEMTRKLVTGS